MRCRTIAVWLAVGLGPLVVPGAWAAGEQARGAADPAAPPLLLELRNAPRAPDRRDGAFEVSQEASGGAAADVANPLVLMPGAGGAPGSESAPVYSLDRLLARAYAESPLLAVSRSDELAALAGVTTARAYPNPEIELAPGYSTGRVAGTPSGSASQIVLSQPIESPWLRSARVQTAQSRVEVAGANTVVNRNNLGALVKRRYFEQVRLTEEVAAAREDLQLTEQIREKVRLRTQTGEGPRFDLIRAESEVAVARKNLETNQLRVRAAAAELRQAVSPALEPGFTIDAAGTPRPSLTEEDYRRLRDAVLDANPDVAAARREATLAEQRIEYERQLVVPQVTLRAAQDRDPSQSTARVGAVVTLPLLNRREGPIAEARAQAERARFAARQREFETQAALDAAWLSYRAALVQTRALEEGILARARSVLEIAEAAYRYGERGILEYLDAQRQFRLARNELIQARFALQVARAEIDRLSPR